ncbi:pre-mRNA cleavage complex 2 protein Pcf11-like isoform X14 [Eriocheir sinensis]|uniref:pre-mRNA cleavage complex 2 protein Pcf11-like isoform X13 n=1 Tax=Eriocheir sinensis TaxID=95602 RepID=UPI0021C856EC|nr:pre-mRNA cleavage complex 2 protein Pcf11-like isoform X13 [Eriocheir sinensis]XP_050717082.1 pre-mRNA cleavage complex 2 protein Pcf11-like isoform X14 [Eriocheir sinensis]
MVSLQDFKASLKLLRGSMRVILSLTDQAKCLGAYAQDVVDAIVETIDSQTQSDDKMPGLYLLDSIAKSVGQPFTEIIQSRVSDVFCRIFMQAKKDIRVLLHTTRLSWSQHFPSEVLIPLDIRVRAMDPAWPDFKVTKVAGQVMGVPAPRSSASSSRDNTVSPAVTSIHEEPSTNQLQFKLVYRGDKQRKEPWPQFTNVGDLLQRVVSPTECTIYTASVFLTPSASPSDVGFFPGSFEVTDGSPGQPLWNESSSSSATHQNPVISEPGEVTDGSPGQPLWNESSSSSATHQNPVISEPDEVTDGSPGQPLWNESSSSSATHQNSFISEPDEVTDGSPGQPLWNESSSSSATHQNSFISEPDEVTDGSPGQPLWNESSSSSATLQNSFISEPGEVTDGSPGQPLWNESSSSSATHQNSFISEPAEVTDNSPGQPIRNESSSSSAAHQIPVISEPDEVTASSPRHTLMKESSSSRDRHRRHSSSVSKRHRKESPASTSKHRHREMASLQDFKASLKLLKGSKKVIFSLTDQAKCLGAYAQGVVNAIVEYIDSQTQSEDKMLGLFLFDSIFKNVGSPFTDIIQSRVSDIFCRIFIEAKEDVRVLLQTTRLSWNGHFPSEVLIPLDKRVRAMDPAWPDFKVTKVAGQGMSLPTPSSSSSHWHNSFVSKRHRGESPAPPSKRCRREH